MLVNNLPLDNEISQFRNRHNTKNSINLLHEKLIDVNQDRKKWQCQKTDYDVFSV